MANPVISVAANYLSDISGGENPVSLDALVKETGLAALTPETVQGYINDLDKAADDGVHSYLCNIDKAEKTGQANQCKTGSDLSANDKRLARDNQGYGYIEVIHPIGNREFYYFGLATDPNFDLPPWRGKNGTSAPLRRFKGNQSNPNNVGKNQTFKTKRVVNDRTKAAKNNRENFRKAVEGGDDKSIGHRAILFDDKGNVIKGANAIRDRNIATELSSSIPSESITTGTIPSKISASTAPKKTSKHPNKANVGATNDVMSGLAALGGLAAMVGIIAALMPLHFVTSAITFLTSITTMLTNVNNVVNSFLKIVDGVLSVFGFKDGTKPLRKLLQVTLDNVFGKENIQTAKSLFAQTVTTIATATKLLEKVQQGRAGTDNKIDEVAFSLGVVNNSMKDAGLIPADSPYMQESKVIDTFVAAREKDNPELKENIDKLTQEIKTQDEIKKELKDEAEAKAKVKAKTDKDTNDLLKLVDATKTNVDKVREKDI
jgi:hypothetical protein